MIAKRMLPLVLALYVALVATLSAQAGIQYAIPNKNAALLSTENKSELQIYQDQCVAWQNIIGNFQWSYNDVRTSADREIVMHIESASDLAEKSYWTVVFMREKGKYLGELPTENEFYTRQEAAYASEGAEALADFSLGSNPLYGLSSRPLTAEELSAAESYSGEVVYSEIIDERYAYVYVLHGQKTFSFDRHLLERILAFHEIAEDCVRTNADHDVFVTIHYQQYPTAETKISVDELRDALRQTIFSKGNAEVLSITDEIGDVDELVSTPAETLDGNSMAVESHVGTAAAAQGADLTRNTSQTTAVGEEGSTSTVADETEVNALSDALRTLSDQLAGGTPDSISIPSHWGEAEMNTFSENVSAMGNMAMTMQDIGKAYQDDESFKRYCFLLRDMYDARMMYLQAQLAAEMGEYSGDLMDETSFNAQIADAEALANELFPEAASLLDERMEAYLAGEILDVSNTVGTSAETLEGEIMAVENHVGTAAAVYAPSYEEISHFLSDSPESAGDVSRTETIESDCFTVENGVITHVRYFPEVSNGELIAVVMPDTGATEIGENAFSDVNANPDWADDAIDAARIPGGYFYVADGIERIGTNAFSGQNMLYLHLPDSITEISAGAFSTCNYLTAVEMPAGVTRLNEGTFYRCPNLSYVVIPETVAYIDDGFLLDCNPDAIIYGYVGSAAQDYAARLGLTFVDIGSGATEAPVIIPEPDITPLPPQATPEPTTTLEPTAEATALPEVETTELPTFPPLNDLIQNNPSENGFRHPEDITDQEESLYSRRHEIVDQPKIDYAERIREKYPDLYDALEKEMADIESWTGYCQYIYQVIDNMDDETIAIFTYLVCITDFVPGMWTEIPPVYNTYPSSKDKNITVNFDAVVDTSTQTTYKLYQEQYNREPTEEELEHAIILDIQNSFFHELGHRYDREPGNQYVDTNPDSKSDENIITSLRCDTHDYLYNKALEHTDPETAKKIAAASTRGYDTDSELTDEEIAIKNAMLEQIHQESFEDYDNTNMILEGISGTLSESEDRNAVALQPRGEDYYDDDGSAGMELYAHYASLKFQNNTEALEVFAEMYPSTYEYFEVKWDASTQNVSGILDSLDHLFDLTGDLASNIINALYPND